MTTSFFIFSRGRADHIQTLNKLPQFILDITTLVVYEFEIEQYRANWGHLVNIVASPSDINGLPARRQWVYEEFGDGRIVVQLDDDLRFGMTRQLPTSPFMTGRSCNTAMPEEIDHNWRQQLKFFTDASDCGFPVGSFFPRVAPLPYNVYPCAMNRRIMSAFWIDTSKVDLSGIDFITATAAEDFYLHCQLLERGIPNVQSSIITLDNFVTGNPGGLSGIRDNKIHNDSMEFVNSRWPQATKLKYGSGAFGDNTAKLTINNKKIFSGDLVECTTNLDKLYELTVGETKAARTAEYKSRQEARKQ